MERLKDNPCVTVLMSVYNSEKYLRQAVESILNQTFADFEFLIVDDGSADSSREILLSYSDPRIKIVVNNENIGLTKSLNRGLEMARGEYIARMDADDVSMPDRIEKQVAYMISNTDYVLVGTSANIINEDGTIMNKVLVFDDDKTIVGNIIFNNQIFHGSVLMRKTIIRKLGGYDNEFIHAQDYDLWLRLIANGYKITNIPEFLYAYRLHDANISSALNIKQEYYACLAVQKTLEKLSSKKIKYNSISNIRRISLNPGFKMKLSERFGILFNLIWMQYVVKEKSLFNFITINKLRFFRQSLIKNIFN